MERTAVTGTVSDALADFLEEWRSDTESIEVMTSGSTGVPKRIALSKTDMRISAESTCRFFGLGPKSVLGLVLPAEYIAGKMVAVRAEVCGGILYSEIPSSFPLSQDGVPEVIDLLSVVPSQINGLLESPSLGRVRAVLVGGAPLDRELEARVSAIGTLASYATYGMTETSSNVALRRLGQPVYVANEGFTFSLDRRGCLVIETERMSFGRLVTNDIVRLHDSSHFEWIGRADNVINSGGIKLHPEELEQRLCDVLPAGHFCLASRPSEKWGREMVLFHDIEIDDDTRHKAESLLRSVERPKAWIMVDALPRTANGKIRRKMF